MSTLIGNASQALVAVTCGFAALSMIVQVLASAV